MRIPSTSMQETWFISFPTHEINHEPNDKLGGNIFIGKMGER